jgi:peptidoglycan/xylan/chitin deacetylase (PgdA/CDA1 family)
MILKLLIFLLLVVCLSAEQNYAQYSNTKTDTIEANTFEWPKGKKMAISLTFDDARVTQPDNGIPVLDKYAIKATFYISPQNMLKRIDQWKLAIINGHEIGNHTLVHPCTGNFSWAKPHALENYTLREIANELDSANHLINETLGVTPSSFAYPCGQTFIGRGNETKSYVPEISSRFETGRGWLDEGPNDPYFCDLSQLTGMPLDGKSFEEIKKLIESSSNKWLILAGHEIDTQGSQFTFLSTLEALCKYASDPNNGIWIDNVHHIASYIREKRNESAKVHPGN